MIIEFTGMPGSGKSTLNKAVQKVLVSKGYKIWTPKEYWQSMGLEQQAPLDKLIKGVIKKLAVVVRAVACNMPLMVVVPWRNILVCNSIHNKYVILNAFLSNLAERTAVKRNVAKNAIALIDEGIVHRAYSLFVLPKELVHVSELISYVRSIELPDLLVYLRSTIPRCLDGLARRGVPSRMERMSESEALSMLVKGKFVLDTIVKELKRLPRSQPYVLEVDGNNLCEAKGQLVNWIDERLSLIQI